MILREQLRAKRSEILRVAALHGARNIRLFGSAARGEDKENSDVDFLVELEPGRSLMDLGGLLADLEDLLGRKVDLVEPEGLHWYVKEKVLREAIPL